ncbi:MAG TPA: lysophospholipid acyltransferase family protein [Oculatellaceae cyanobacterium]
MAEFNPATFTPFKKKVHVFTARYLLTPIYLVRNRIKVSGRENVPKDRPCLIVGNHISNFDPPLLCIATDVAMAYVAKEELFDVPILKHLINFYAAIPIDRDKPGKSTIKTVKKIFQAGWNVGMFIEGTRSKIPGQLGRPHLGAAYFAYSNNVPILPVGLVNMQKPWQQGEARIGEIFMPDKDLEKTTWETMERLSALTGYKVDRHLAEKIEI